MDLTQCEAMGRRRATGSIWAIVFGVILILLAGGFAVWRLFFFVDVYRFAKPQGEVKVGNCLTEYKTDNPDVRAVLCTDPAAKWQIVDTDSGVTYVDGRKYCDARSASTVVFYDRPPPWESSTPGTAVCLTPRTAG
jgi:hypothetical protein